MKRTRAQQPKKALEPQDPTVADAAGTTKPQHRAKQPRQPKAAKKPAAATDAAPAAAVANAGAPVTSPGRDAAPTVPDVCGAGEEEAGAAGPQAVDWDLDAGLGGGAWWTWGVDEDKLLGWFPFVEEDFRCLGGRAGDAEVAFDDDIWRIHQIHEIPNYAAK